MLSDSTKHVLEPAADALSWTQIGVPRHTVLGNIPSEPKFPGTPCRDTLRVSGNSDPNNLFARVPRARSKGGGGRRVPMLAFRVGRAAEASSKQVVRIRFS